MNWHLGHYPEGSALAATEVSAPTHAQCNIRHSNRTIGPAHRGEVGLPVVVAPIPACPMIRCLGHENHRMDLRPSAAVRDDGCQVSDCWLEIALPHLGPWTAEAWRKMHGLSV
jgi:hypothetical protein